MTYAKNQPKDKPIEGETPLDEGDYFVDARSLWLRVRNMHIAIYVKEDHVSVVAHGLSTEDADCHGDYYELERMDIPYPDDNETT